MRTQDGSGNAINSTSGGLNVVVSSSPTPISVSAAQSGNWPVRLQDGSGNTINSTSNALNTSAVITNVTTTVNVNCTGCSAASNVTVANVTTTVNVNVLSAVGLAQGSTTSGVTGSLVMGAVTTAAPSYSTSFNQPLSLDTTGRLRTVDADPCASGTKQSVAVSQTTNTQLIGQVSAQKAYVCSILIVGSTTANVSLVEGTGTVCASSTVAIIGGTAASSGPLISAAGGFAQGNGASYVAFTSGTNVNVCLLQSTTDRVAGVLTYVRQ